MNTKQSRRVLVLLYLAIIVQACIIAWSVQEAKRRGLLGDPIVPVLVIPLTSPEPLPDIEPEDPAGNVPASWPDSLTYHEAETNPTYYLTWLQAKNPGVEFVAIKALVTGYCPCKICCGSKANGTTRTGARTKEVPYGVASPEALVRRQVHVPGYLFEREPARVWKIDDTGSALNENWENKIYHFDVRFASHDWAKRWWGKREMTVYLVKEKHENK